MVLIYGGGSIKRNGIYDAVRAILDQEGKQVAEIAGVMPNPTLAKLYEALGSLGRTRLTCCWRWAEARCATMPRRSLCRSTVRRPMGEILSPL